MGSDLTSLTPRLPQPHVDPDLPSGRAYGYAKPPAPVTCPGCQTRMAAIGRDGLCLICPDLLLGQLRKRLALAATAAVRCSPNNAAAAVAYQGQVAEAVTYLTSKAQVAP